MGSIENIPDSVRLALSDAKARLISRFGARLIETRLFGSFARGQAHVDSDVDMLVVLDRVDSSMDVINAIEVVASAGVDHGIMLEALVLGAADFAQKREQRTALARALDTDGVVL